MGFGRALHRGPSPPAVGARARRIDRWGLTPIRHHRCIQASPNHLGHSKTPVLLQRGPAQVSAGGGMHGIYSIVRTWNGRPVECDGIVCGPPISCEEVGSPDSLVVEVRVSDSSPVL